MLPAYDAHGPEDGEPLVLLHSGGMAAPEWEKHVDPLAEEGFRLLVPDLPGHGRTPLPEDEPLTLEAMADAVLEVLDEEGVEGAHVLGSSLGGATALRFTLEHPQRVGKLVLYRMSYRKSEASREATRMIANPERWRALRMDTWLSRIHEPQGGPDAWETVVGRVREVTEQAEPVDLDALEELPMPVLLIVGDADPVAPLEDVLDMRDALPDADLWVMPGASHVTGSNTWRRPIFDAEVARWLQRA